MRILSSVAVLCSSLLIPCAAQNINLSMPWPDTKPAHTGPTGTVTGTVYAEETRGVVRLANIVLVSTVRGASDGSMVPGGAAGQTDADGHFRITGVPVGEYYVTANATGYMSTAQAMMSAFQAGTPARDAVSALTRIRVAADSESSTSVSLSRGAVIAGRISWADGSPVTGARLVAHKVNSPDFPPEFQGIPIRTEGYASTDDQGRFRLTSLSAGDYVLSANISIRLASERMSITTNTLSLFYPGTFRQSEAKPVSVQRGETRGDADMLVDVGTMHRVSGHIDLNALGKTFQSGSVRLVERRAGNDSATTIRQNRAGTVDAHGDFSVAYVPSGNYAIEVELQWVSPHRPPTKQGDDVEEDRNQDEYHPSPDTVSVADKDVTGLKITLQPKPAE